MSGICSCGPSFSQETTSTSTEMVRPEGATMTNVSEFEHIEMAVANALYSRAPMLFGGYPILLYRLDSADPQALKMSLSKALVRHPWFAGRLLTNTDIRYPAGHIVLNNVGVPFTTVVHNKPSAPVVLEEESLFSFGHLPNTSKMRRGQDAVMTVKLTIFKDKSAVLAIARSHAIADGTYTWAFIYDWAAASQGKILASGRACSGQEAMKGAFIEDIDEVKKLLKGVGFDVNKKWWAPRALDVVFRTMDMAYYAGLSKGTSRIRLKFSNSDLDKIKKVATPPSGSDGDGWVSTQEALAAHILFSLGHAIIPAGKADALCAVEFWLDVRKLLGLPSDAFTGIGFTTFKCDVEGLLEKKLWQVATDIHDTLKTFPQKFKDVLGMVTSAMGHGMAAEWMLEMMGKEHMHQTKGIKYDVHLQLNNQSKRVMPDFGTAGGVPSAVLTNAGPCLLLPTADGVELFLVKDAFGTATDDQKSRALRLMTDMAALES